MTHPAQLGALGAPLYHTATPEARIPMTTPRAIMPTPGAPCKMGNKDPNTAGLAAIRQVIDGAGEHILHTVNELRSTPPQQTVASQPPATGWPSPSAPASSGDRRYRHSCRSGECADAVRRSLAGVARLPAGNPSAGSRSYPEHMPALFGADPAPQAAEYAGKYSRRRGTTLKHSSPSAAKYPTGLPKTRRNWRSDCSTLAAILI